MPKYAALLRAVNVGGTGKLPMADLRQMCADIGFRGAKTLLASGNVVFETDQSPDEAAESLNTKLTGYFGSEMRVFILTAPQMTTILNANPFAEHPGNQVGVMFVDALPSAADCQSAKNLTDEKIVLGQGVVYVKFPSGMGCSKLVVPGSKQGTMRNMNTVGKLATLLNA